MGADKVTEPKQDGVPSGTTDPSGVTQVTPGVGESDVQKRVAELEKRLADREQDINKLKSSLQSGYAKKEKEWQQEKGRLEQELEQLRVSRMDETERKKYEADKEQTRLKELADRLSQYQQRESEMEQRTQYVDFFKSQFGIEPEKLQREGTLEDLWNSGWSAVRDELSLSKKELEELKKFKAEKEGEVEPPPVVERPGGTPKVGNTYQDLIKTYGSMGRVYSLIEQGQLSPDILPK